MQFLKRNKCILLLIVLILLLVFLLFKLSEYQKSINFYNDSNKTLFFDTVWDLNGTIYKTSELLFLYAGSLNEKEEELFNNSLDNLITDFNKGNSTLYYLNLSINKDKSDKNLANNLNVSISDLEKNLATLKELENQDEIYKIGTILRNYQKKLSDVISNARTNIYQDEEIEKVIKIFEEMNREIQKII